MPSPWTLWPTTYCAKGEGGEGGEEDGAATARSATTAADPPRLDSGAGPAYALDPCCRLDPSPRAAAAPIRKTAP